MTRTTYAIGTAGPTSFSVAYAMYSIPDQLEVFYEGALVATTGGVVSGSATLPVTLPAGSTTRDGRPVPRAAVPGLSWPRRSEAERDREGTTTADPADLARHELEERRRLVAGDELRDRWAQAAEDAALADDPADRSRTGVPSVERPVGALVPLARAQVALVTADGGIGETARRLGELHPNTVVGRWLLTPASA